MKKRLEYSLLLIGSLFLFFGCYDDKGSYDYRDVNEVSIDLPKMVSVLLPKKATDSVLLKLSPKLQQTMGKDMDNLNFIWEKREYSLSAEGWDTCGVEKDCHVWLKRENVQKIVFRLRVNDKREDGTEWYKEVMVVPVMPYSSTWFVLQNENDASVLGCVDGKGEGAVVTRDVYKEDMGKLLPVEGKPTRLMVCLKYEDFIGGYINDTKQSVIGVITDRDVWLMNAMRFNQIWTLPEMLYGKRLQGITTFSPEFICSNPATGGELFIENGELFCANADAFSVYYPVALMDGVGTSFRPERVCSAGLTHVIYDKKNHRFLKFNGVQDFSLGGRNSLLRMGVNGMYAPSKVYKSVRLIGENVDAPNLFNPDDIGDDKVLVDMVRSGGSSPNNKIMAFAYSKTDGRMHVYEFDSRGASKKDVPLCSGKFEFDLPGGARGEDVRVACSFTYDRIFFMSAGNKIYKVDLNRTHPKLTVIYEHPNAGVRITQLRFKYDIGRWGALLGGNEWVSYENELYLGAALDYGNNTGGIVEMKLNVAGDLDRDAAAACEFKGFGKIVDVVYSFK